MSERVDVMALFTHFLLLACMAVGGMQGVMPDMHRYLVDANGWITSKQFADAFALAQAAPGPNMMWITLVGWEVAGLLGATVTTIAIIIPPATFTLVVIRLDARMPGGGVLRTMLAGLAPITIGLVLASGWILLEAVDRHWIQFVLTALALVVTLRSRLNPLWLIAAGALIGMSGLMG